MNGSHPSNPSLFDKSISTLSAALAAQTSVTANMSEYVTVMYGSESWGMKVTERQKLNVFEMKCLRSMTGVSRLDRVRNEVVRARTGVRRELAARVDVNVLRWVGHVERMDNERLLKKVMNAKVDGRSARGRPRFGWMDGVKRALNDRRMDIREASERARNRNEWRMIVTQF